MWLTLCHEYLMIWYNKYGLWPFSTNQIVRNKHNSLILTYNAFIAAWPPFSLDCSIRSLICDPKYGFLRSRTIWHISKGEQVRNVILIRLGLWNKVKVIVYRCLTPFWTIFHLYCSGNKCYRRKPLIWRKLKSLTNFVKYTSALAGNKGNIQFVCVFSF